MITIKNKLSENFVKIAKQNLIDTHNRICDEHDKLGFHRFAGLSTINALNIMSETHDMRNEKYNPSSGGNRVAMRSLCIGLAFHKKQDLNKLIEISITLGKLTHTSPTGFLAGFTVAFFLYHLQLKKLILLLGLFYY